MARVDVLVLGAGIVGTSVAFQLARRGLSVALLDRGGPGEETSFGNAGVIGGAGVYPAGFPRSLTTLLKVAFKQSPMANYHLADLPGIAPWLFAYWRASSVQGLEKSARALRPLAAQAAAEHEVLLTEAGALSYLRKNGWLSIYRTEGRFKALSTELALAAELGVPWTVLDTRAARELEPALEPVFERAIHWTAIASVTNPLSVTRAYAARLGALGGRVVRGDARSLARSGKGWGVDSAEGTLDAAQAVIALGPWSSDLFAPLGLKLPLAVKRGYHRHFRARGNAGLSRPVVDVEVGYALAPLEQGIRLTTGVEFADRDVPPTPVQFDRLLPEARRLFPLGEPVDDTTWLGRRPAMPDSVPVIGRAPGQSGLWLAFGHGHMGLSFAAVTGRLIAEMMTGATPFCDPTPYRAERFA